MLSCYWHWFSVLYVPLTNDIGSGTVWVKGLEENGSDNIVCFEVCRPSQHFNISSQFNTNEIVNTDQTKHSHCLVAMFGTALYTFFHAAVNAIIIAT